MSTHAVNVIRIGDIEKHPNADTLGIVHIWGYTCCVRLGDFQPGDLAVYIEPDYVVPDRPEYAFLAGHRRIKTKRLRGTWSQGLLIHAPESASEGDDVMDALGITRYEPSEPATTDGECEAGPALFTPTYDVESYRRYQHMFTEGETVVVTEKIHGANARYVYHDGRMYCGSRRWWKREDPKNLWWMALAQNPWIVTWCETHPDKVLYGEVFGQVQDLKYGAEPGQVFFRVFDILDGNRWMNTGEMCALLEADQIVPLVHVNPLPTLEELETMSRGKSLLADHLREGIVIRPIRERSTHAGRCVLKLVSDEYLSRGK